MHPPERLNLSGSYFAVSYHMANRAYGVVNFPNC